MGGGAQAPTPEVVTLVGEAAERHVWERVTGQERAVQVLRRAVVRPAHAYLLAGPLGSGMNEAARCFGAALVCADGGCGRCSSCTRALRGRHPDVVELEPEGRTFMAGQAAGVIREAFASPVEARRKVIVLLEAERMNEPAANKLLKTLEEPPATTHFVLVTSSPADLLPTVRSRCQPVDFGALSEASVRNTLVAEGVPADEAALAARLAGGRLDRARQLSGEYASLRRAFAGAAGRLDGTGAAVATVTNELLAAVDASVEALEQRHARDRAEFEADAERGGYAERTVRAMRRRLEERQKRVASRARLDALLEGLAALETVYRDALVAPVEPRHADVSPLEVDARAALSALDTLADARRALVEVQVNQALLLHDLLLRLPAAPAGSEARP